MSGKFRRVNESKEISKYKIILNNSTIAIQLYYYQRLKFKDNFVDSKWKPDPRFHLFHSFQTQLQKSDYLDDEKI